jgi:hypothetical protein
VQTSLALHTSSVQALPSSAHGLPLVTLTQVSVSLVILDAHDPEPHVHVVTSREWVPVVSQALEKPLQVLQLP